MNALFGVLFWLCLWLIVAPARAIAADDAVPKAGGEESKKRAEPPKVELRGRVVCLPEAMHELYGTELPTDHTHLYGFRARDGVFYTLLRTRWSEGLFVDERLRELELIVRGQVLPKTQIFDVTSLRSVKNGVVHDLFYYCDICAIETPTPGPCLCCQAPVELVEKPLKSDD
jgi:hypothetical protein